MVAFPVTMANNLIHEKSPYLLQHAHNPVDWHPWGTEAFEKARKEDKVAICSSYCEAVGKGGVDP